jgi:hypothetical protein
MTGSRRSNYVAAPYLKGASCYGDTEGGVATVPLLRKEALQGKGTLLPAFFASLLSQQTRDGRML